MESMYELSLSDEKFLAIGALRDLLFELDPIQYCAYGSFLSAIQFMRPFTTTFDLLVEDELQATELIAKKFEVDNLHGTITIDQKNNSVDGANLKVRIIDSASKNELMRKYLIENSDSKTCIVTNKSGHSDKFDIRVPKRGPTVLCQTLEIDDTAQVQVGLVEKIVWSLNNIGVASLLREARFVPKESVYKAADIIEDLFVSHANKTASMLHSHSSGDLKNISAADLKKLGRPYAALLRA